MWKSKLKELYPEAKPVPRVVYETFEKLSDKGFTPKNTLFMSSVCRDELSYYGCDEFARVWGENFELAGLAGYPTAGVTGFTAASHHVPEDGKLFIFYGSHLGVSDKGNVGKVKRKGMQSYSNSCGALINFLGKIKDNPDYEVKESQLDIEQNIIEKELLKYRDEILGASEAVVAVTEKMYQVIDFTVLEILAKIGFEGEVVLLGAVTINTPEGYPDYLDIKRLEIYKSGTVNEKWT